jgi:hypothetical protein
VRVCSKYEIIDMTSVFFRIENAAEHATDTARFEVIRDPVVDIVPLAPPVRLDRTRLTDRRRPADRGRPADRRTRPAAQTNVALITMQHTETPQPRKEPRLSAHILPGEKNPPQN